MTRRVEQGDSVMVTRGGAELRPLLTESPSAAELIARRRILPVVDPESLRTDLDALFDPNL